MTQGQLFEPEPSGSKLDKTLTGLPCRVLIDVSGYARELDYLLPDQLMTKAVVGSIVRVRLRNRVVKGWLTSIDLTDSKILPQNLKPVLSIYSIGPSPEVVELSRWVANQFVGPMRTVLASASPNRIVKTLPKLRVRATTAITSDHLRVTIKSSAPIQLLAQPQDKGTELAVELSKAGQTLIIVKSPQEVDKLVGYLRRQGVAASNYSTDWAAGLRGDTVVGTAKATLASLAQPHAFLVLDSHSSHYKMRRSPHWDVSTVLSKRSTKFGIPLFLVSAFPSVEASAEAGRMIPVPVTGHVGDGSKAEIVDLSNQEEIGSKLLSSQLISRLRSEGNGLVVVNRKSASNLLYCASCAAPITSEDGSSLMVEVDGQLVVPGGVETRPVLCQSCGSTKLKRYRLGVKGLAAQLEALVGEQVVTIDAGTKQIPTAKYYVGTSAAMNRNLPVSVIAFVDIDSDLAIPGTRTRYECASQVISAKRALVDGGTLLIQTRQPENDFLRWVISEDPTEMLEKERAAREVFGLPPFGQTAQIGGASVEAAAELLRGCGLEVLGPKDGKYLVKSPTAPALIEELSKIRTELGSGLKVIVNSFDM